MAKSLYFIAFLGLSLLFSKPAISFDAVSLMGSLTKTLPSESEGQTSNKPENTPVEENAQSCGHATSYPVKTCDKGAGFLCVSTPAAGTTETFINIEGSIDIANNQLGAVSASVQNEYSNNFQQLKFEKPDQTADCGELTGNYCLDADGFFSIKVPLGNEMGPFSITVSAARANGEATVAKVRTSRIVPVELENDDIKVTANGSSAQIVVDLLKGCAACDFIGTSTGAVTLTVTNTITGDGGVKTATERTDIASGGAFALCMQLGTGTNSIIVSACNEANDGVCPSVELDPISSMGLQRGFRWLSDIKQFYSADTDPEINLSFKLEGEEIKSCEESNVKILFNREPEKKLCPDANGVFTIELKPSTGINVGSVFKGGEEHSFSFGWGEMFSPFNADKSVKDIDELWIDTAGGFIIGERFLTGTITSVVNNFFKSDEFKELLVGATKPSAAKENINTTDSAAAEIDRIRGEIPNCSSIGSGGSKMGMKITSSPEIGKLEISAMEFGEDTITATISGEDIKAGVSVLFDVKEDGSSSKKPMPLLVNFKELNAPIDIKIDRGGDKPLLLLTGRRSDCDYMHKHACKGRPAVISGKEFRGGATKQGGFVKCDSKSEEACKGINILNRETGILTMSVLDAINEKLYCDGSATLTYLARERMKNVPIAIGCAPEVDGITPLVKAGCTGSGLLKDRGWIIPVGIDIMGKKFQFTKDGISGEAPLIFGSREFFADMPEASKNERTGFIRKPFLTATPEISATKTGFLGAAPDFGIAFGLDMINAFLFVMNSQRTGSGLLDWEIDEVSMKKMGLDIVDECFVKPSMTGPAAPSAICQLKPRVSDILGTAPTTNGYLDANQPLRLRLRGDRAMPPRVNFFENNGKQYIELQLGDVELAIFVLAVDKDAPPDRFGNLTPLLDTNGNAVIVSSNPLDADPENGALVKFHVSAQIALEISGIDNDESDPSKFAIKLRPDQLLTRIAFKPVAGGNTTLLPEASMISSLQEKINYGINIYSDPEKALKLSIPKEFLIGSYATDAGSVKMMGLKKILFGNGGLKALVERSQEYFDITTTFRAVQTLNFSGKPETFVIPD